MQPRPPLSAACTAKDWKDGASSRQRPAGSDRFDPPRMRIWPSPGDVIVQEHHKRLARGYSGGSGSNGSSEDAAN